MPRWRFSRTPSLQSRCTWVTWTTSTSGGRIDTPGILDTPEERNTIEMQSITAMAHLRAVVLYIVDASEQCGYTIKQQADLFHSIKPLFANKPLVIVVNKVDVQAGGSRRRMRRSSRGCALIAGPLRSPWAGGGAPAHEHVSEEGVMEVKRVRLRPPARRVDARIKLASRRAGEVLNRLTVAGAGTTSPGPPSSPLRRHKQGEEGERRAQDRPHARPRDDLMVEGGGAGVYNADKQELPPRQRRLEVRHHARDLQRQERRRLHRPGDRRETRRARALEEELEAKFQEDKAAAEMEMEPTWTTRRRSCSGRFAPGGRSWCRSTGGRRAWRTTSRRCVAIARATRRGGSPPPE